MYSNNVQDHGALLTLVTWVEVEPGESQFLAALELLHQQVPTLLEILLVRRATVHQVRPMGEYHVRVVAIFL